MEEYKNIEKGELQSVDLDLNNTNILDVSRCDQFFKTCGTSQQFLIVNENIKVFKLVLTGGTLSSTPFLHATKAIDIVWESGAIADYNALSTNRLYVFIEKTYPSITLTLSLNVEQ